MMPNPNMSFRAPALLRDALAARNPKDDVKNSGAVAKREVERWYTELDRALARIRLDPAEAVLLISVIGKSTLQPHELAHQLHIEVERDTSEGFGHVRDRLVQKMFSWDVMRMWAVVDAVERYEIYQRRNPQATLGMALHVVGLHSYQVTPDELTLLESTQAVPPTDLEPLGGN
jgi:hypothetical protein